MVDGVVGLGNHQIAFRCMLLKLKIGSGGVIPAHQNLIQKVDHSQPFTTVGMPESNLLEAIGFLLLE